MYTGTLKREAFQPDPAALHYEKERQAYMEKLSPTPQEKEEKKEGIGELLARVCPEDGALIALILFLLCDNTENDVVLLGILLYVLLSS